MNATIIRNPISGSPPTQTSFARVAEAFTRAGWRIQVRTTKYKGHARDLAEQAARNGCACVIVAGGDGSLGQAVDGLLRSGVPDVQLGLIPMGTGNVFAREAGLPFPKIPGDDAPVRAARVIIANAPVRVDVGQANGSSFLCWAGVGLDAAIARTVESKRSFKRLAPLLSYGVTALQDIFAYAPARIRIEADDELLTGRFPLVIASNIRLYARYFRMTPGAKIDDGQLDLLVFTDASKLELLRQVAQIALAPEGQTSGLIRRQVRQVRISADPPQPYHLDGDPAGQTPLVIRSLRQKLLIRLDRSRIGAALTAQG